MYNTYTDGKAANVYILLPGTQGILTLCNVTRPRYAMPKDCSQWPSGLQRRVRCVQHGRSWIRAPNLHQCWWTCLQVCGLKRFGCHADPYTVSRCCTRGESEDHTSEKACKGSTLALKPRTDITKSPKQGYQWPHEKDIFIKKERLFTLTEGDSHMKIITSVVTSTLGLVFPICPS